MPLPLKTEDQKAKFKEEFDRLLKKEESEVNYTYMLEAR